MAIKVQGTTVIDDSRNLKNSVNLNATGNVYANTFIGDGSQLTNLPPSSGTVTAVASGALSDGSTVVINSDGTVSAVDPVAAPLTSTNYIGISAGAYANGATATVQVAGSVDDAQSGLTPGQQYFVLANGSIDTTAGSPSVIAGTAVAATKLLVKG